MAKACLGFVAAATGGSSLNDVQSSRGKLMEEIASMQAQLKEFMTSAVAKQQQDFDRRTTATLERLMQNIPDASGRSRELPVGQVNIRRSLLAGSKSLPHSSTV